MDDPRSLANVSKNFAGRMNSSPTKAVLFTLQKSFGQCRVLRDILNNPPNLVNAFTNLVCFPVLT
jgi:hypothetical protein